MTTIIIGVIEAKTLLAKYIAMVARESWNVRLTCLTVEIAGLLAYNRLYEY